MRIVPTPGRLVRDPWTGVPVPQSGQDVPENAYWLRRLAVGDVTRQIETSAPLPIFSSSDHGV